MKLISLCKRIEYVKHISAVNLYRWDHRHLPVPALLPVSLLHYLLILRLFLPPPLPPPLLLMFLHGLWMILPPLQTVLRLVFHDDSHYRHVEKLRLL